MPSPRVIVNVESESGFWQSKLNSRGPKRKVMGFLHTKKGGCKDPEPYHIASQMPKLLVTKR